MTITQPLRNASRRDPRNWTLRAKLVASMIALFLAVSLGTGAMVVLATRQYLAGQVDAELTATAQRAAFGRHGFDPDGDDRHGPPGAPGGLPGTGGTVLQLLVKNDRVVSVNGSPINSVVGRDGQDTSLDAAQVTLLTGAGLGSTPRTIDFGTEIGRYRVLATSTPQGMQYTGLPIDPIDRTTNQLLGLVTIGTLLGLVVVGGGGTYLVRRNLEPLRRVAGTARKVSTLSLETGEVALVDRVPARDTDPRTEVGQVGLALNSLLDNVDGALQARHQSETRVRQFVADASHELRTPLASIRGYAELSRREPSPVPSSVTHALSRIESESLRMQGLVEDLLLLARLDAGRPLEHEAVDLTLLAIDTVSDARAAAPEHVWSLDLPDEPIEVTGDQARLHQVLANLLANARAHTPTGTRVTTSVRRGSVGDPKRSDVVTISVTDDGPGIPEALQPNVFERFTRGDVARNRAAGSTGLGLSIVAAVTAAHDGRVGLRSRPGATTIFVELPTT